MEYMSAPQAAEKWGMYLWLIPKDAEKPIDGRTKQEKELRHE